MKKKILSSIIFSLFSLSFFLLNSEELRPYRLINADKLTVQKNNEENITHLYDNVHFFYGKTEFFSDMAEIYDKKEIARLIGNVVVNEDSLKLEAEWVEYDRNNEILRLRGKVNIYETHADSTYRTYNAEKIIYSQTDSLLTAKKNVQVFDSREKVRSNSDFLQYSFIENKGFIKNNPELIFTKKDTLKIRAEKIEYYKEYQKIVANFNVETIAADFQTNSDFMLYLENEEKSIMLGEPEFFSESAFAKAQLFNIFFEENKLNRVELRDSSYVKFSSAKDEEKRNWIDSSDFDIFFKEGIIKRCKAMKNVDMYVVSSQEEKEQFINKTKCDTLNLHFNENRKLQFIEVDKKVTGKYIFTNK